MRLLVIVIFLFFYFFYSNYCKCAKTRRKKNETLAACISEMAGAISFKFGMYIDSPGWRATV